MPKIFVIGGCNGAGKTTASYTILPDMFNCHEFVNSDEIAMRLSPSNPEAAAIRASRIMLERMRELIERGTDFGIETTLATRTLNQIIREAQMRGYIVTLIFFWLNVPQLAIERVKLRVASGGHNVPEQTVMRRYETEIKNVCNMYIPVCDYWMIVDNSNTPSALIAEGGKGISTKLHNKTIYNLLINYERTRNETT